jgi:hypothetical protein
MPALLFPAGTSLIISMKPAKLSALALAFALGAAPVFAQSLPRGQRTDGDSPTMVGPASQAFKQRTDGEAPAMIGPGSKAFVQKTQPRDATTITHK